MLKGMWSKLKEDLSESNEYRVGQGLTLIKGLICVGGIYLLDKIKQGAETEGSMYSNKIAQNRAVNTMYKVEMEKKAYAEQVAAAKEKGIKE